MSIKLEAGLAGVALSALLMARTPAENAQTKAEGGTETAATSGRSGDMAGEKMSGPQTPFSPSEDKMHRGMMQAAGSDIQETYALKMIEHHRGAVEMSQVVLRENPDPRLRAMAEKPSPINSAKWPSCRTGSPPIVAAGLPRWRGRPSRHADCPDDLTCGSRASCKGLIRGMIPHHYGAILICEQASLTDPELVALCGEIGAAQEREIVRCSPFRTGSSARGLQRVLEIHGTGRALQDTLGEYPMAHTVTNKKKLVGRVRRIAGQLSAIERAIEGEEGCSQILQQVAAARGAMGGLLEELVEDHLRHHVAHPDLSAEERQSGADELIALLRRYSK